MSRTIQISDALLQELLRRKLFGRETYEDVIWNLIEDTCELDEETKKEIMIAREEIQEGKTRAISQVKRELGL